MLCQGPQIRLRSTNNIIIILYLYNVISSSVWTDDYYLDAYFECSIIYSYLSLFVYSTAHIVNRITRIQCHLISLSVVFNGNNYYCLAVICHQNANNHMTNGYIFFFQIIYLVLLFTHIVYYNKVYFNSEFQRMKQLRVHDNACSQ